MVFCNSSFPSSFQSAKKKDKWDAAPFSELHFQIPAPLKMSIFENMSVGWLLRWAIHLSLHPVFPLLNDPPEQEAFKLHGDKTESAA
ncbi:hypothetical protein V9T40_005140 [Parthenolecanium corni]|uniref:Uncharacterized protein n=1 Tax=Parthenolecanium corni TaxID=536013 RepID=A0AAN9Y2S9_9HEMI